MLHVMVVQPEGLGKSRTQRLCGVDKDGNPGDMWDKRRQPGQGAFAQPLQHRDMGEILWRTKNALKSEEWSKRKKDFVP